MKIGLLSYDFDPPIGGLGVHVKRLTEGLKAHPEAKIMVFSPSLNAEKHVGSLARAFWGKPGGSPIFSFSLFFSLPRLIRQHQLDLVHAQSGSGGVWILRKPSVPLIVTSHHTYNQEIKYVFAGSFFKKTIKRFIALLEKRTYRIADRIMCVSADTLESIVTEYGIDRGKCIVVENSIDIPALSSAPRKTDEILYLGRLEPRKGIDTLLTAFEHILNDRPTAHLTVIGKNLLGDQFIAAAQKKFGDHLTFLGHVTDAERTKHLETATMLVVPSLIEGFGLVAAEGLAAGICVVASDAPGLRTVVRHERTGLLFESANSRSCADAMLRILRDDTLRTQLSHAGSADARARFTLEKQVSETMKCYEQALK